MGLFVVTAFAVVADLAITISGYSLADRAARGEPITAEEASTFLANLSTDNNFLVLAATALAIAFMAWLSRTVENVPPLGGGTPSESPRWAIIWWFVPVAFLWKPYGVVRETWDRLGTAAGRGTGLVLCWWVAWIIGGLTNRLAASLSSEAVDAAGVRDYIGLTACGLGALLLSAVCGFFVVREVQRRADLRAEALGLEPPQARWPSENPDGLPAGVTGTAAPLMKTCPQCAESVRQAARICRYCGYAFPDEASKAES
jgi:hypothetical protein